MESARRLDEGEVVQELGVVDEVAPVLRVSTAGGTYRAARAVSCLVEPMVGDTVLTAVSPTGRAWVLAVLERDDAVLASGAPTTLSAPNDLELDAGSAHAVRLRGKEVEVRGGERVSLAARALELTAVDGRAFFERLGLAGGAARIDLERVKTVVGLFDSVLDRFSQRVKRSYRFVEEIDVTRAHQVDIRTEQSFQVRSQNTLLTSDGLTKVEAEQIHLG